MSKNDDDNNIMLTFTMPFLKNGNRFTKDDVRLKMVEIKEGGMDDMKIKQ